MTDDEWFEQRRTTLANRKRLGYDYGERRNTGRGYDRPGAPAPMNAAERSMRHRPTVSAFQPPLGATCLGSTALFYDDISNKLAVAACRHCPAMWPCRHSALDQPEREQHGVQGGLTAWERIAIRRRWTQIDWTVMRQRRADAVRESWTLRQRTEAA